VVAAAGQAGGGYGAAVVGKGCHWDLGRNHKQVLRTWLRRRFRYVK
jgi:hypothetical protein